MSKRKRMIDTISDALNLMHRENLGHTEEYRELVETWEALAGKDWKVTSEPVEVYP